MSERDNITARQCGEALVSVASQNFRALCTQLILALNLCTFKLLPPPLIQYRSVINVDQANYVYSLASAPSTLPPHATFEPLAME